MISFAQYIFTPPPLYFRNSVHLLRIVLVLYFTSLLAAAFMVCYYSPVSCLKKSAADFVLSCTVVSVVRVLHSWRAAFNEVQNTEI